MSDGDAESVDHVTAQDDVAAEIVVGVGETPAAAAALRWAAQQSQVSGLPLRIVHAWQMSPQPVGAVSAAFWAASAADARARATRWVLDTLGGGAAHVRWTLDIAEGPPGPVLVARARRASMLVLGTGDHVGLRRLVTGSVSHYAISHSIAPVVAVRGPEPASDAAYDFSSPPGGSA